ncbi:MAG: hypothetical protein P4L67_03310 [Candidatus Pacebacteria bacterium]|nr:hypothetical protein [Candidatus Paceibacterota bacterium]
MEKKAAEQPKVGQSLHLVRDIIENIYKQTPELEEEVKREELSVFKNPLPKLDTFAEKARPDKEDMRDLSERVRGLKKSDEVQKMTRRQIEEEFERARNLYRELDKAVTELTSKKNEMEDRYIRREQEIRGRVKEREEEIGKKGGLDQLPNKPMVNGIRGVHTEILTSLDDLQKMTEKVLEQERSIIKTFFQGELMKLQDEFDKQKESQATSSEGQKEDERELRTNLELVTSIAQHIDTVNRKLAKRREELKIEVTAQENDNGLLQSQLAGEKSRTKKLEQELEKLKKIAAEAKVEYEHSGIAEGKEEPREGTSQSQKQRDNNRSGAAAETSGMGEPKLQLPAGDDQNKAEKYEALISQLKRRVSLEKANSRQVKTMYTKEIETRLELEQLLRKCVDDVKAEINAKRAENRVLMHSSRTM